MYKQFLAFGLVWSDLVKVDQYNFQNDKNYSLNEDFNFDNLTKGEYAIITDPQLGMFNAYYNPNPEDSWDVELENFYNALAYLQEKVDFVIITGDLVNEYENLSIQTSQKNDLRRAIEASDLPILVMPGNHDLGNGFYYSDLKRYRDFWGQDYYHFIYRNQAFMVLDTQLWKNEVGSRDMKQLANDQIDWVNRTLQNLPETLDRINVFMHVPFFTHSLDEDEYHDDLPVKYRTQVFNLFTSTKIKTSIFSGHTHLARDTGDFENVEFMRINNALSVSRDLPDNSETWDIGEDFILSW